MQTEELIFKYFIASAVKLNSFQLIIIRLHIDYLINNLET